MRSGRKIMEQSGYKAFIPETLPPTPSIQMKGYQLSYKIGELQGRKIPISIKKHGRKARIIFCSVRRTESFTP